LLSSEEGQERTTKFYELERKERKMWWLGLCGIYLIVYLFARSEPRSTWTQFNRTFVPWATAVPAVKNHLRHPLLPPLHQRSKSDSELVVKQNRRQIVYLQQYPKPVTSEKESKQDLKGGEPMQSQSLRWVSRGEKECGKVLSRFFPQHRFLEGYRPRWLVNDKTGHCLELDLYCPPLALAVEYNGEQHYNYIPRFHGPRPEGTNAFAEQLRRDQLKLQITRELNIHLIVVPYTVKIKHIESFLRFQIDKLGISIPIPIKT
jgi:hypothetical protein